MPVSSRLRLASELSVHTLRVVSGSVQKQGMRRWWGKRRRGRRLGQVPWSQIVASDVSPSCCALAGLDNPVFYNDNNKMLLGDAKDVLDQLRAAL